MAEIILNNAFNSLYDWWTQPAKNENNSLKDKTDQAARTSLELSTSPSDPRAPMVKFETKITWGDEVYRVWTDVPADALKDEPSKTAYAAEFTKKLTETLRQLDKTDKAQDLHASPRFDLEFSDDSMTATTFQPTATPSVHSSPQKIVFKTPELASYSKAMRQLINPPLIRSGEKPSKEPAKPTESTQGSNRSSSPAIKATLPFLRHAVNSCFLAVSAWAFLLDPDTRRELNLAKGRLSPADQKGPKGQALEIIQYFVAVCDACKEVNQPVPETEVAKLRRALSLLIDRKIEANKNRFLETSTNQEDAHEAISLFRELIFNDPAKIPTIQKKFIFQDHSFAMSSQDKNPGTVELHLDSYKDTEGNYRVKTDAQGKPPALEDLFFTHHWNDQEIHEYKRKETNRVEVVKEAQTQWSTFPGELGILLNRTIFDERGAERKIQGEISVPLTFSPCKEQALDKKEATYQLDSVILHQGSQATNAHYTAIVRQPGTDGKMHYFLCDDCDRQETLKLITDEQCKTLAKGAYALRYKKTEPSQTLPSPQSEGSQRTEIPKTKPTDSSSKPKPASDTDEDVLEGIKKRIKQARQTDSHPQPTPTPFNPDEDIRRTSKKVSLKKFSKEPGPSTATKPSVPQPDGKPAAGMFDVLDS